MYERFCVWIVSDVGVFVLLFILFVKVFELIIEYLFYRKEFKEW